MKTAEITKVDISIAPKEWLAEMPDRCDVIFVCNYSVASLKGTWDTDMVESIRTRQFGPDCVLYCTLKGP